MRRNAPDVANGDGAERGGHGARETGALRVARQSEQMASDDETHEFREPLCALGGATSP